MSYEGEGEDEGELRGELTRGCMHQTAQEGQCQQQQLQHLDTVRSGAGPVGGEGWARSIGLRGAEQARNLGAGR